MKVGDRVEIVNQGSSFHSNHGKIVGPGNHDMFLVALDRYSPYYEAPIPFSLKELKLISKCPCKVKACIAPHTRKG
jgi:hypothetical protein